MKIVLTIINFGFIGFISTRDFLLAVFGLQRPCHAKVTRTKNKPRPKGQISPWAKPNTPQPRTNHATGQLLLA